MKNNTINTIKKELRSTLRDKKSLLMMFMTPLMIPMFIFIFGFIYDNMLSGETKEEYTIGINYKLTDIEEKIIKEINFNTIELKDELLDKEYQNGNISAYIKKEDNNYVIYSNNMSESGGNSINYITSYLDNYNIYLAQNYLTSINANIEKVYNNVNYTYKNLEGSNDFVNELITIGFIFAIMAITLTAIYSATDMTAGEKEKGTLETILTFPIKSEQLIMGKYWANTIACSITAIISTTLAIGSLIISKNIFNIYKDVILNFNFVTILISLLIMFAYSLFISGLSIAIASTSKTYKEAQSKLTPLSLLTMIPMFLDILKIDLTNILSLIPIINHTMLLKIVLCNNITSPAIINIIIMFISTIIYSFIIIKLISKQYESEKILFGI